MTAVHRVDVPLDQLASRILGLCGKDPRRVASIFRRGTLVTEDTRFRWLPLEASEEELAELLGRFPDHDPDRSFDRKNCIRMEFHGFRGAFEITRDAGRERRLFRRKVFWDDALELIENLDPQCQRHSYSDGADIFVAELTPDACARLRQLGRRLRYTSLETQLRSLPAGQVSLSVPRPAKSTD